MDLTGVKKLLLGISVLGNQVLLGEEGYGQGAAYSRLLDYVQGKVHAWVGQIVTFSRVAAPAAPWDPLRLPSPGGSPARLSRGCPGALWEAPQAVCWLLGREPKPPA